MRHSENARKTNEMNKHLHSSFVKSQISSVELAELISAGVPGPEQDAIKWPDDELIMESPELPTHCGAGTRKYLGVNPL